MTTRFIVAALLGLTVAASTVAGASAKTVAKTVDKTVTTTAAAKSAKVVVHRTPRLRKGATIVKHARPAVRLGLVRHPAVRARVAKIVAGKAVVRVVKRPLLQKQAMVHRFSTKKTVIR